jgi:putative tryptophan/tyrosine transport system substrate-binding protein
VKRREFIAGLGSAVAWPIAAQAQQPVVPVIGFLGSGTGEAFAPGVAGFRRGLSEFGFVEGRNVAIEYRWAAGEYDRLPALAAELARLRVAVVVAAGSAIPALAAKGATSTIPIVFCAITYPVKFGLVNSLSSPGGNITGASWFSAELGSKRLGLLRELIPNVTTISLLINPTNPTTELQVTDAQNAAGVIGLQLAVLNASSEESLEGVFAQLARQAGAALLVSADPFFDGEANRITALAARYAIPSVYQFREYVLAGGLMSYGSNLVDIYRQAGVYTGRILNGARPADLPVTQPTKFEFVLNLKTAKALGLTVPPNLLAVADEVIE